LPTIRRVLIGLEWTFHLLQYIAMVYNVGSTIRAKFNHSTTFANVHFHHPRILEGVGRIPISATLVNMRNPWGHILEVSKRETGLPSEMKLDVTLAIVTTHMFGQPESGLCSLGLEMENPT
jgi:hypothetical protein